MDIRRQEYNKITKQLRNIITLQYEEAYNL